MDLTQEQLDLLHIVEALNEGGTVPGTRLAGQHLLDLWEKRGDHYRWDADAPWHGTAPYAGELQDEGLLNVMVGDASFHSNRHYLWPADQYTLSLTNKGHKVLDRPDPHRSRQEGATDALSNHDQ